MRHDIAAAIGHRACALFHCWRQERQKGTVSGIDLAALLILACIPLTAAADDDFRLSGFGSLGVAWFSDRNADYVGGQAKGPGRSKSLDYGLDSLLAIQADWTITPKLAASAQVMSAEQPDRSWAPFVTLANLRYAITDDVHVRAGYLPNEQMLAAEYRWVNYGNPWPRLPTELYRVFGQVDANYLGTDINVRTHSDFGLFDWRLAATEMRSHFPRSNAPGTDLLKATIITSNLQWEKADWKVKLTMVPWVKFHIDPELSHALLASLTRSDPGNALYYDNKVMFRSIGLSIVHDSEDWVFIGEAMRRKYHEAIFPDTIMAYATLGHRFGAFLPYTTVARSLTHKPSEYQTNNAAAAATMDRVFWGKHLMQSSIAFGLAYDLRPGVQLKTQLDFIRPDPGSVGTLFNVAPAYNQNRPPIDRLFSVGVDFIF